MKKTNYVIFGMVFILSFVSSAVLAASGDKGPASTYQVVVTKFEMYNGTSWITVFSGSSTVMDIASVNVGEAVGNLFAGLNVPDGSYTQVRVTISDTFIISGRVGTLYTTAAKAGGACVSTSVADDEAQCSVSIPGGMGTPDPDPLPTTLTVTNGIPSHKIRVNFDISEAIEEVAGSMLISANPDVTMAMIAL